MPCLLKCIRDCEEVAQMSNYKFYNNIFAKVDPIEQT